MMSTKELIELAQLDAMGLLEEQEALEFEAAIAAAPAEVREQIRKEQARMCVVEPVLPAVEPPEHLRAMVLARVHEAIVETVKVPMDRHTQIPTTPSDPTIERPLAGFAQTTDTPADEPAMVELDPRLAAPIAARSANTVRHDAGRAVATLPASHHDHLNPHLGRPRIHRSWRTAAIVFAAAAAVFAVVTARLQTQYDQILLQKSDGDSIAALTQIFGAKTRDFLFSPQTNRTVLHRTPVTPAGDEWNSVEAVLWQNPDWSEATLVCQNLPTAGVDRYEIIAIDEEGNEELLTPPIRDAQPGVVAFAVPSSKAINARSLAIRVVHTINGQSVSAIILATGSPSLG